ncbi:hypothetical protein AMK14_13385 [Streptomyces sp. TSRI0445]|uniref:Uncharacterized protein n=1 Tax=Streptomyces globisporus TaxID=1908 RepID=A0ABN8V159_STRGL|nr:MULTISPECIES: hypothetical protein [Streptomyces]PPA42615.1 hypothetical protein BF14_024825 [Streptomyces griseus]RAN19900.1 hypothetical protein A3838_24260 [Streptomyces badius]AWL88713.1 hypothetical protein DIJ69_24865 [Streptomyces globisporus]OKI70187.1 hypothetical protein AMK14_13385 [Streptomyces sp. TSRI0445]RAN27822.1 hypothetical protein A3800_24280 [Streptomyces badius]
MHFSSDDLVCRIACNLEQVHTAEEAMRAWLPLVSELQPVSAAFEAAHPDGLRRGYLADLLVVSPLQEDGAGGGSTRSRLLATVEALAARLGLDPAGFVADEDGVGGVLDVKDENDGSPYGAYLILALTGADPLNPGGEEMDYEDTGEDLL